MKSLPSNPNLDFLKKESKKLRTSHRNNEHSSCSRIKHFDTSFTGMTDEEVFDSKFSILDAQRVVAREYGFSSWTKLKRFVESTNTRFNQKLHDELIQLRNRDSDKRQALLTDNTLYDGYHSEMEALHNKNAACLDAIIKEHGWPGTSLVGLDGCRAAWMIAQHAISQPDFQMKCLDLLKVATERGEVPARQVAFLTDRILFNKSKPQMYGLIGSWNSEGKLSYGPIMDEDKVNQRRAISGLGSIEDELAEHQKEVTAEGGKPPEDFAAHQKKSREWAKKSGWI